MSAEAKTKSTEELLKSALDRFESGDRVQGWRLVKRALSLDPGIGHTYSSSGNPIRTNLQRILREARLPSTLSCLAAICRSAGDDPTSKLLLQRYTELAPQAIDKKVDKKKAAKTRSSLLKRAWSWLRLK